MSIFADHAFDKSGLHAGHITEKTYAVAKPPSVVHPLNVPATPGDAPPDFTLYRLECLTIKTISSYAPNGIMTRRPALVVQMILEKGADQGATYSLRTLASLEDLKVLNHPQAAEAEAKACRYYENKLPLAQQERVAPHKRLVLKMVARQQVKTLSFLDRLQKIWA